MRDIDGMVRNETETANNMDDMVKDSIGQIKVPSLPPLFLVLHSRTSRTHFLPWLIGTLVVTKVYLAY